MLTRGKLSKDLIVRIWNWAQGCVQNYELGNKPQSLPYATRGIESDAKVQAQAKAAECAVAICFGLDPLTAVDWSPRPDGGSDLVVRGVRIDVKRTKLSETHRRLFWPSNKSALFDVKQFDALVLVKTEGAEYFVAGWIGKDRFRAAHRIARSDHADGLDEGDMFVTEDELEPPHKLGAGMTQYLNDHACSVCGSPDAPFGFSVPDARISEIEWRCRDHQ